ncbi:MAG: hypothetical protein KC478_02190, partial [Bacteriovoracaceae bacterium]|nr:hypothetical protein [Bacteriovoracaceae bacterium]
MKHLNIKTNTFILLTALFMSSCETYVPEIEETFHIGDKVAKGGTVNGICYSDQYAPDEADIIRKLDILVVPDTSVSLKEERGSIANGFDNFIKNLPTEIDYKVGVVLGHSGKSPKSGKLFQRDTEPLVLDSASLTTQDIVDGLYQKIKSPAGDGFSDGGEMGMYSLVKALTENKESIQSQGFLRSDAALVVIFVADEQDICAEYPEGVTPVEDKQKKEPKAKEMFCDGITPSVVLDLVKQHQGERPFVIGGVIYNNSSTMPINGENEIGYGYKETIELAGGITVDLASGDYGDGLTRLGKMAQVAVKPENEFNLKTSKLDLSTVEVLVDGSPVDYSYTPETNQIALTEERGPFSVAKVSYCEKEEAPMIASKVIAGGFHSCAILIDGNAKCWGRNNFGQLGLGNIDNIGDDETLENAPTLALSQKVIDMSAGLNHTCAVLEDGSVKCWGQNNKGQLGLGHTDTLGDDETLDTIASIPLAGPAKRIYSGTFYNCALLENKKVQCWGDNSVGQLGYGSTETLGDNETLENLPLLNLSADVIQMDISTVSSHTCAALSNGELKCWGINNNGQLGYGHTNNLGDDEDLSSFGSVPFGNNVLQLATGFNHTCAITGGQKARCWGANLSGQTGLGVVQTIGDDEAANSANYIDLSGTGSDSFNMIAAGNNHSCVIGIDNKAYCWGLGSLGATGLGHTNKIGDDEAITLENTKVNLEIPIT